MDFLPELFQYDAWATLQILEFCARQPPKMLEEIVVGTDRSILHTLTHVIGSNQEYLESLTHEQPLKMVRQGEILPLDAIYRRCESLLPYWEAAAKHIKQLDVTLPADGSWPETPHAQDLLVMQAIQHGIDHRTQICTTLTALGLEPPQLDVWAYWLAKHKADAAAQ